MQFDIIEKAGLTQREFAQICAVSRATVNLWVNGHMNPHRYIRSTVQSKVAMLQRAVTRGLLPVVAARGPERDSAVQAALKAAASAS